MFTTLFISLGCRLTLKKKKKKKTPEVHSRLGQSSKLENSRVSDIVSSVLSSFIMSHGVRDDVGLDRNAVEWSEARLQSSSTSVRGERVLRNEVCVDDFMLNHLMSSQMLMTQMSGDKVCRCFTIHTLR